MPRIAIQVYAFVEKFLTDFRFAAGRRIRAPAFVSAASIKAHPDQVICRLRFKNDWIHARVHEVWAFRRERLFYRFTANARRIEPGNIKMVAKKIAGTAAIRSARRDRQTNQTGTAVMKISVFGAEGRCGAISMMKTCANHPFLFA